MNYEDWVKTFKNRTPEQLANIINAIDVLVQDTDIKREFSGTGLFGGFCIMSAAREALEEKKGATTIKFSKL